MCIPVSDCETVYKRISRIYFLSIKNSGENHMIINSSLNSF